jgi:Heparinase II/III-like protein/Heparinase II/III N-terminus
MQDLPDDVSFRPRISDATPPIDGISADLMTIGWYLSRLASMRPAEIAWRVRSSTTLPLDWARSKGQAAAPAADWTPLRPESYPIQGHAYGPSMEQIRIFDLEFPLGFAFDWHCDYRDGRQVERRFAGALNIRDTAVVGDVKYVWEPSRHQHLSALAFSVNAEQHAGYIVQSIDSWLHANPYLRGVHWTSSLELAERVLSWALLYPRIAEHVGNDRGFRERWLGSVYLHLARIARKLSLYSSGNNHLIGELVGLYVGSSCFNFWPDCRAWRDFARQTLEQEILFQVGEDGVNREQAVSYHLFTFELFLLAFLVGRNSGTSFSEAYAQRLRVMAQFLNTIATPIGDLPWYGDSDDARGFLFSDDETALEVTTQLAGLLFDEPSWFRFRTAPTQAARALVPELLPKLVHGAPDAPPPRELFTDAGMACVQTHDGNTRLVMDFGPLGFNTTAAHGHADALSIWLAIGDEYFMIDAGTFAYHSHPEWRAYFRGTAAHNTARVDGLDQSEITGRFLWGSKAAARLLRLDSNREFVTIEAEHSGYDRLPDPVIHRRSVRFDRATGNVRLEDSFQCADRHAIELFFHMHEEAEILRVVDGHAQVAWRGCKITFSSSDSNCRWDVVTGSDNPILGWRSPRFNQKQPIPTLRIRAEIFGPSKMRTSLDVNS